MRKMATTLKRICSERNPRRLARASRWCAAAAVLLTGCATQTARTTPSPDSVPAPSNAAATKSNAPVAAQSNALAEPITVEAAIERATRCNPQVNALRAAVEVAKQRKSAASDIQDPEGIMTWGKVGNDFNDLPDNVNDGFRIGGRFYPPNPFTMTPKVNAGAANFHAEAASLLAAKWVVESEVRRLYAEIHYLDEDVALTEGLAHQYDLILQDERAREGQGATTASEIVTAVHQELQARNELDKVRYRWQSAQRELAGLLNVDLASIPLRLRTNGPDFQPGLEPGVSADRMQQIASQHRNDLAALHWRTLAAHSAYVEARNVRVPSVKEVEFTRRDSNAEWWLGIGINVPLFSWTINNTDGVQLAEFKLAEANESNGLQTMQREVRDAVDEYDVQRRQQERNQKELAPLLAEMQQTLDLLKRTPNVMPSQVAATEAQITESLRLKLESDWLYQRAGLNLERAVGTRLASARDGN